MSPLRHGRPPQVGSAMTPFPHFVKVDDPIGEVERLMRQHEIRHVPVQDAGSVVGIISERDLRHVANPSAAEGAPARAGAVMLADPYVVEADAPLARAVSEMAERHIGSAIVLRHGKLAGILSVTDICRILGELLDELYPGGGGNTAA